MPPGRKPSDHVAYNITSSVAWKVTLRRLVLPSSFTVLSRLMQGAVRKSVWSKHCDSPVMPLNAAL